MRNLILIFTIVIVGITANSRNNSSTIYNENLNPDTQLTEAIATACQTGKHVVVQLGGNWCRWCIMFAKFVEGDAELKKLVDDNFIFIHVNYNPHIEESGLRAEATSKALSRLGNPLRFGFPVLVVLDGEGNVIHTQDSALLESGDGYDKSKVVRFFEMWTPSALGNR